MALSHSNDTQDNEPAWSDVDKTRLPENAFVWQAPDHSSENKSTWGFPHHHVRNGEMGNDEHGNEVYTNGDMYLNVAGLDAAWAAAQGARSGEKASDAVINHLQQHREAIGRTDDEEEESCQRQAEQPHQWFLSSVVYDTPPVDIDAERGIIQGAAVATAGEAKGHGVHLDSDFLGDLVEFGNSKKQGLKARFGHPNMSSTALGTFLGRWKSFRKDGDVARADLYLSNSAEETPNGDLKSYVLNLAQEDPKAFGNSIVFKPGELYKRDPEQGDRIYQGDERWESVDGKVFVELNELMAADTVDDPAANPDGLFSQWSRDTWASQVTEFLDTHPAIYELVAQKPEVIDSFLERYNTYRERQGWDTLTLNKRGVNMEQETQVAQEAQEQVEQTETETVEPETAEEQPEQEGGQAEGSDEVTFTAKEFADMANAFGNDIATEVILSGGTYADAQQKYVQQLEARVAELEEQKQSDVEPKGEPQPAEFGEEGNGEPEKVDIKAKVDELAQSMSKAEAWKKVVSEYPTEYAEYVHGEQKQDNEE